MTREQIEDRMMDYLYEELSAEDRTAFERAVQSHPDLQEEIVEMQKTRSSLEMLPEIEVPNLVKANILREARLAVADPQKSWFDRLANILMRPGMATAFIAVLVAGVGLFVIDRGGVFERDEQTTVLPAEDVSHSKTAAATEERPEAAPEDKMAREAPATVDMVARAESDDASQPPKSDNSSNVLPGAGSFGGGVDDFDSRLSTTAAANEPAEAAKPPPSPKRKESFSKEKKMEKGVARPSPGISVADKKKKKTLRSAKDTYGSKNASGLGSGGGAPIASKRSQPNPQKRKGRVAKEEKQMETMAPIAVQQKAAPPSTSYVAPATESAADDSSAIDLSPSEPMEEEEGQEELAQRADAETGYQVDSLDEATPSQGDSLREEALVKLDRVSTRAYVKHLKGNPKERNTKTLRELFDVAMKAGDLQSAQWAVEQLASRGTDDKLLSKMKSELNRAKKKKKKKTAD